MNTRYILVDHDKETYAIISADEVIRIITTEGMMVVDCMADAYGSIMYLQNDDLRIESFNSNEYFSFESFNNRVADLKACDYMDLSKLYQQSI
ncbi:hypothetical protein ACWOBH_06165 [Globicatella sanguinis]